ncbi:DUF6338 family protein [Luteimonas sp. A277]
MGGLPIVLIEASPIKTSAPFFYYLFYFCVLLVAPILWVVVWKFIRTRDFFQRNAPHPTAKPWDFVFQQRRPYWVKVILKDGKVIAGRYAHKSFSSSSPAEEQIYLEETWVLGEKGEFVRPIARTAGVLVVGSDISHIEFRE